MLLLDLGSQSIKVYGYLEGDLKLLRIVSWHLKDEFTPEYGITDEKNNYC